VVCGQKMKRFLNWKLLLLLIFLLAGFLRVYQLGSVPAGFHADEAAFGYNAYSLLHTMRDEYGKFLPLVLKSFGDYKGALYAYLDIPFIALLGLTPFAERLPSAIFGSLTVLIVYFFAERLLKNRRVAIISSFLFAISPWAINISRATEDVTVALFFTLLMSLALLQLREKFTKRWFLIAVLSALAAIVTSAVYRIYVVLIPLIFLIISLERTKTFFKLDKKILTFLLIVLAIGIIYSLIASVTRFGQISIFSSPQTDLLMQEQIREGQFSPVLITRAFHNKIINYSRTILENTGQYFTADYLFLNGGYPQREKIPNTGLFYIWEAPFLLIGIYAILRRKKRNEILLLLWWLVLLLPSVITSDEIPNVHRNLVILISMTAIIATGIYEMFNYKVLKNLKILPIIFIAILTLGIYEFLYFGQQYLVYFNVHQPWYRGYAYKQLTLDLNRYYPSYKKIVITKAQSSPYIYLLFYTKYDPQKYQSEGSPRDLDYTGFDKYYFAPQDCPLDGGANGKVLAKGRTEYLYIDKGTCAAPINAKVLDVIKWEDGTPAFKVMQFLGGQSPSPNSKF
jgi:4-amino-4-deoxy-L-arabinose transferase-like glycosyltransferase